MSDIIVKCNHAKPPPPLVVFSVFENSHGEQWVAAMRDGDLVIAGGDMGWKELVVQAEQLRDWKKPWAPGIILDRGEQLWMTAVLEVARRRASK